MNDLRLTENQQALVDAEESMFAAACPGAGKTRAMVARFLKRTAEEERRGVALLSFTNAAVDEVRRRCGEHTRVLEVPHFVGTFDTFIHRFIVTPMYTTAYRKKPNYVQRWRDVPSANFRLSRMGQAKDLQLDWFDFAPDGRARLIESRIPRDFGNDAVRADLLERKRAAEEYASHIFGRLIDAGTISCVAARCLAEYWLQDAQGEQILAPLLRSRFAEVIVDEAQDCGREELRILQFLKQQGTRIIMVGDTDQSIYEFRSATPDRVRMFADNLPGRPIELKDNWRSTPAICAFNRSLRCGQLPETARGDNSLNLTPVHLIEYRSPDQIVPAALDIAEHNKLTADDLILLSHAEKHGMKAAGVHGVDSGKQNRIARIASAGHVLRSRTTDPRARRKAVDHVQHSVLAALTIDEKPGMEHLGFDALCERVGVDPRWLETFAVRMAISLDTHGKTRDVFAAEVRAFLRTAEWGNAKAPSSGSLGRLFRAPNESVWDGVVSTSTGPAIAFSTVHGVKGKEYPGVVLVLPERLRVDDVTTRTVVDDWEGGHHTEARRVLYVAASRAQQLLICAIHKKYISRIEAVLDNTGVPYTRV
ncbi:ATP-dependent helicase (plasmid) [Streptomyces sp. NBC_01166]|uniref:ATP-dependent helicase n=1 Tax=Streptomyces sp. NBC_01166 TaxID=2903755 RepID=UPI002F908AB4|nr:ATP-dependent helicase [Streptomyces sp. NBC_01166]